MTVHDVAAALPGIAVLRERCRALAMLEAIINREPESRRYSFDARWAPGTQLASMRNGGGDDWSIVFSPDGCFVRGFDHESPMSPVQNDDELWPGLVDTVPEVFADYVAEPAFSFDGTFKATVCLWRRHGDDRWHAGGPAFPDGDDPDGADWLFQFLVDGTPAAYRCGAEAHYGTTLDLEAIGEVFAGRPLTGELVRRLDAGLPMTGLAGDLARIGYPSEP
ncbi:hypothetical protein QLQ12_37185 [Actinoplanes sp. NEAU-A12]|uniref:Uncharacterized protein n=2 Tax=Actinoplanes sandaracinus TaxID=3045177 RepID=A0ABT6WX88_9ACTN|nr:hypothetical protein [Actinoplanes sandaracinus]